MKHTKIFLTLCIIAVSMTFMACQPAVIGPGLPPDNTGSDIANTPLQGEELHKFSSVQELKDYLDENTGNNNYYGYGGMVRGGLMMEAMAAPTSAPMVDDAMVKSVASDFSQTNVQVEGVDEADIVKNDNKYIYSLVQDKLVIVNAFPAESMDIVSETDIDGTPQNLFVNGDRLVVFTTEYDTMYTIQKFDFLPRERGIEATHAYVYDITDRANPVLVKDYNVNGGYFQSRMIGDYVYFVAKDSVYYYSDYVGIPEVREADAKLMSPEIYYFDNPETDYVFHTVASFNIQSSKDSITAKSFLMGYSNTLYVSEDNMYITYQKNLPYRYYEEDSETQFFDVVVPLLPNDVQSSINNIWNNKNNMGATERWDLISVEIENMYNAMEEKAKKRLVNDIQDAVDEYQAKQEADRRKTIIHKIAIDHGALDWQARGEVQGYLLNQFSLDEFDNNLRVATTTYIYTGANTVYNNVYVLDNNLKLIGSLEGLAEEETIYSTRFMGNRLYMVTFQRIDPLFVIDLSNPKNPAVLGELKIPGFSDYLHPYDETHIIGIGKETKENSWGGISTAGVKVALFDVSNVKEPIQIDSIEIGTSGTDSEALQDHKAVLFDKARNLLVIPVREIKGPRYYDSVDRYYKRKVWQGAYVLEISPSDGILERGTISHAEDNERDNYYWTTPTTVRRSLYMDDVLYTVSGSMIRANDIDSLDEISEVDLPYDNSPYYPIPYY